MLSRLPFSSAIMHVIILVVLAIGICWSSFSPNSVRPLSASRRQYALAYMPDGLALLEEMERSFPLMSCPSGAASGAMPQNGGREESCALVFAAMVKRSSRRLAAKRRELIIFCMGCLVSITPCVLFIV